LLYITDCNNIDKFLNKKLHKYLLFIFSLKVLLMKIKSIVNYIPALFTTVVWGSTFVASKHVLHSGVSPILLMTIRFLLAYILLFLYSQQRLRFEFNLTEFKIFLVGICGGSVYFLTEYMALQRTSAVNVGLISATVPIISTAIDNILKKQKFGIVYIIGSFIAFIGVVILVTNGNLCLQFFPIGDLLAILSSMLWALYTVVLSRVDKNVPEYVIERRMLFYSLITIFPVALLTIDATEIDILLSASDVWLSVLYLGVVASALCLWLWNISINAIGIVRTNNFLYLLPVVSLIVSAIFITAEVSIITIVATILIFIGIFLADK